MSVHWEVAYETMMFFVGHVSGRHLPPQTNLNYPEPADQNALGVSLVFFVATMSALSVFP